MEIINGFKVLSNVWVSKNGSYKCNAQCRVCNKEFKTNYHALHRMKSCGCARPKKFKPLSPSINGFKTVKCLGNINGSRRALVICKICKKVYECDPNSLKYRKHCGCLRNGKIVCIYAKSNPKLCRTYFHMKNRCYNKNSQDYYNYGARGIKVCKEWLENINTFCEWGLKNGYKDSFSIDRIDNKKGYFPSNCKWSTPTEQSRNTRRTKLTMDKARLIRENPESLTNKEIALKYDISIATIFAVRSNTIWKEECL